VVAVIAAAALVAAASWVTIPYYAEGPGPAREVTPLIDLGGRQRYEPSGRLALTTVTFERLTPVTALGAWLDPDRTVIDEDLLYPPGVDPGQEERRSLSQMDQSKINAAVVVLRALTDYPEEHGEGVLIQGTQEGCPADGRLFPGDRIVAIDGEPIDSYQEAGQVIRSIEPGTEMVFELDVDGAFEDARFARERCIEGERPIVGVNMVDAFPFPISISSGEIGGPSAGLMFAVGLYELMTPEDLTRGRFIAGTGTLGLDGAVGPIGGIRDKLVAAREAGAEVFLVPAGNAAEIGELDTGDMELITVASFEEAVEALRTG
jgi:PDZ domain-containing protein